MNGKHAIKKNEANHPVNKSIRLKKAKVERLNKKEQIKDWEN